MAEAEICHFLINSSFLKNFGTSAADFIQVVVVIGLITLALSLLVKLRTKKTDI